MSTQAALLPKKEPQSWVKTTQISVGCLKLALGVGSLLYLLLCLRHCESDYISWFATFAVLTFLDGLEMLLSRWLPRFPSSRCKAVTGCAILWTSWMLSFCYIACLIWGAIILSWGRDCDDEKAWAVLLAMDILCGVHSVYTVVFACLPLCCVCCPFLGTLDSSRDVKKKKNVTEVIS